MAAIPRLDAVGNRRRTQYPAEDNASIGRVVRVLRQRPDPHGEAWRAYRHHLLMGRRYSASVYLAAYTQLL